MSDPAMPFALSDSPGLIRAECRITPGDMIFIAPLGSSEGDPVWRFAGRLGEQAEATTEDQ